MTTVDFYALVTWGAGIVIFALLAGLIPLEEREKADADLFLPMVVLIWPVTLLFGVALGLIVLTRKAKNKIL